LTPCSATRLHKVGYVQRGDRFSVWAFRQLVPWSFLCSKVSIPMVDVRRPTSQGEGQDSLLGHGGDWSGDGSPFLVQMVACSTSLAGFFYLKTVFDLPWCFVRGQEHRQLQAFFDVVSCLCHPVCVSCALGCHVRTLEHCVVLCCVFVVLPCGVFHCG
jgi:hypothetical protein